MPSDWVFIAIGLMSIASIYAISTVQFRTWMKKQNFNLSIQAEKLKLQKLRKEMGMGKQTTPKQEDKGLLEQLGGLDMDKIKTFVNEHPQWTSWIALSIGMVAILIWSARDVGLLAGQWAALIIATIAVAGLAVWIIGWEDEEEEAGTLPGGEMPAEANKEV